MKNWRNEQEAREEIKNLVKEYYYQFKKNNKNYSEGNRITYAARVYDEKEMCALTDATLDFWLTTGRFSDEFESNFSSFLGVKFAHLVNSGSSANLIAAICFLLYHSKQKIFRSSKKIEACSIFPALIMLLQTDLCQRRRSGKQSHR